MLEKILYHIESLLLEEKCIETQIQKKSITIDEAYNLAQRACNMAMNPCSEVQIIHSLYQEIKRNSTNFSEFALGIEKILIKHSITDKYRVVKKPSGGQYGRLIDVTRTTMSFLRKTPTEIYLKELGNIKQIKKVSSLKDLTNKYLELVKEIIQTEVFDHVAIHTYTNEDEFDRKPSHIELEYYQKWIDGTVEYSDIIRYGIYDFRTYMHDQKLPYEQIEQIEQKQEELFKEALSKHSKSLLSYIEELEEPKQSLLIHSHISLLERFLSGDTDEVLIQRIDKFIKLEDPVEVLLEYDELIQSDYYDYYNLTVFKIGAYRKYSPTFTAHLIFLYLRTLKTSLEQEKDTSKKKKIAHKKQTKDRIAFHFKGEPLRLRSVFSNLQLKIDLLKDPDKIEELVSIFTSDDITPEQTQIYIDCETQQFAFIITQLKPFFTRLTAKGIEETKSFYSKNGALITANNLHGRPPKGVKQQEAIDKIIHQMK